jgi:N-acetyl-anhydromuramyl-L-alanine amidase AmpD
MREIKKIIVHCAATKPGMDIGVKEIRAWHMNPSKTTPFSDIGYHYVIRRSGEVEKGRDVSIAGAHAFGYNFNSIGVCLVGGIDDNKKADDNYTLKQYNSLLDLIKFLKLTFPIDDVFGHRDLPDVKKDCPCYDVRAWLKFETTLYF